MERDRHRALLDLAIEQATQALAVAAEGPVVSAARVALVKAHAEKAEDACHGAGQLSLSAQRAPTREACDEGWQRVDAIVRVAEASARAAASAAGELDERASKPGVVRALRRAMERAEAAARNARRIVETRNHAYTFHADSGFSFGEGWYLAAAAVLDGVSVQVEQGKEGTRQAERFLRDAGLEHLLQPYRSRPRAMKHVTAIVGRAFRPDPSWARQRLRAAFLGDEPVPSSVRDWVDARMVGARTGKKVLLWIRDGAHHPARNTRFDELLELSRRVEGAGLVPVLTGDALREGCIPAGAIDLILFWKDPIFRQDDQRRAQLQFFEHLRSAHGVVGQLGVTTAGMDGPALMGLPTTYLTDAPNVRMREWVGAVPGYDEVVRESGYLERVSRTLSSWVTD